MVNSRIVDTLRRLDGHSLEALAAGRRTNAAAIVRRVLGGESDEPRLDVAAFNSAT